MDGPRESELIARARLGDEGALSELFEDRRPRLVRMVELRLDPNLKRRLDPADVLQDVWLDVARRFPEWCAQAALSFPMWLRLLTGRALIDAQRRHLAAHMRDALREVPMRDAQSNISAVCCAEAFLASATSPTRAASREEIRARVITALEELEGIDREIVALRHFEGLSNEEAAAELSIEPAAASKRFVRALLRLRPALESLAPGPAGERA